MVALFWSPQRSHSHHNKESDNCLPSWGFSTNHVRLHYFIWTLVIILFAWNVLYSSVFQTLLSLLSLSVEMLRCHKHAQLTHWVRVMHICSDRTLNGSDNGLSPGWRPAIILTNAWVFLITLLGTNFSEILIEIYAFSLKCISNCRLRNGSYFVSASMC